MGAQNGESWLKWRASVRYDSTNSAVVAYCALSFDLGRIPPVVYMESSGSVVLDTIPAPFSL